jgi:hypothetical integral membrane protein (TIGR02206 family)
MDFFQYESPYRTGLFIKLTWAEYTIPFLVLFIMLFGLIKNAPKWRSNLEGLRKGERIVGIIFLVLYLSHYVLRFAIYGFDTIILPFQLCSISMLGAIILLFTRNRSIYAFVLYAGVLGGLVSLFTPVIGYDSSYYRYYQFYASHLLLILTPFYFLFVHGYIPSKKEALKAYFTLQGLIVFMGIFNLIFDTDFMFVFLDPNKLEKFPIIRYFGGIPLYILPAEMLVALLFFGMHQLIHTAVKKQKIVCVNT